MWCAAQFVHFPLKYGDKFWQRHQFCHFYCRYCYFRAFCPSRLSRIPALTTCCSKEVCFSCNLMTSFFLGQASHEPHFYRDASKRVLEGKKIVKGKMILNNYAYSPYAGGVYKGKLVFPSEFPFKPPAIYMSTPNGRFKTDMRLCLSISGAQYVSNAKVFKAELF